MPVGAESMESYEAKGEKADVILVCVKNILSIPVFHLFKTFPIKIR